ncbi:nuclear transport factor 2 family protein [Pontibacter vulgaris]|uniref:nuclear transport factor 2 family protein n=1 Tax=Pontibacter vulgaris TaxID=2905679 RepID=UPI001FA8184D
MDKVTVQGIIEDYIYAYNIFNVEDMLANMAPDIEFESITNGEVTLEIKGIENFRSQAEAATNYFTKRKQTITSLSIRGNTAEAVIDYEAKLAIDLPNGLKAGDKLELKGKSVFTFEDGKIMRLQDYS